MSCGNSPVRTTNVIESNFDPVRSRTNVSKRSRSAESATCLVWALLVRRKERRRRLNGKPYWHRCIKRCSSQKVGHFSASVYSARSHAADIGRVPPSHRRRSVFNLLP